MLESKLYPLQSPTCFSNERNDKLPYLNQLLHFEKSSVGLLNISPTISYKFSNIGSKGENFILVYQLMCDIYYIHVI